MRGEGGGEDTSGGDGDAGTAIKKCLEGRCQFTRREQKSTIMLGREAEGPVEMESHCKRSPNTRQLGPEKERGTNGG